MHYQHFHTQKGKLSKQVNTTRRSAKTHKECSFFLVGATFWTNLQVLYVFCFHFDSGTALRGYALIAKMCAFKTNAFRRKMRQILMICETVK